MLRYLTIILFVTKLVTVMAANSQFAVAVHILAMLAKSGEENVKSDCIAASVNTNPVVIRRLLCELQRARLVASQTGASGGTRLARQPEDINLWEVYRAALPDNEVFSLHRNEPNQKCLIGKNILKVLEKLQAEIDEAIEEKLARYSLADVIESVESKC